MRLHRIAPGHVELRHHPASRWVLLALAGAIAAGVVWSAYELRLPSTPLLVGALGTVLLLGAGAVAQARRELEIGREAVRWTIRGPLALRSQEWVARRDAVDAVVLRARVERGARAYGGGPFPIYEVELGCAPPLPEAIALFRHRREPRARQFARELCVAAGLALLDTIGEGPERREVGELRGPPPRRLARPATAPPRGVRVRPDPLHGEVATLSSWWGGRARLWVADGELHLAQAWFSLPARHRRLPVEAIERVRVEDRLRAAGPRRGAIALVGRFGVVRSGVGGGDAARRWLRAWLEARLWPGLAAAQAEPAQAALVADVAAEPVTS